MIIKSCRFDCDIECITQEHGGPRSLADLPVHEIIGGNGIDKRIVVDGRETFGVVELFDAMVAEELGVKARKDRILHVAPYRRW